VRSEYASPLHAMAVNSFETKWFADNETVSRYALYLCRSIGSINCTNTQTHYPRQIVTSGRHSFGQLCRHSPTDEHHNDKRSAGVRTSRSNSIFGRYHRTTGGDRLNALYIPHGPVDRRASATLLILFTGRTGVDFIYWCHLLVPCTPPPPPPSLCGF